MSGKRAESDQSPKMTYGGVIECEWDDQTENEKKRGCRLMSDLIELSLSIYP